MAKSLRSKSVRKAKAARRLTIHKPVEDARLGRLARAQAECTQESSLNQRNNVTQLAGQAASSSASSAMQVDSNHATPAASKTTITAKDVASLKKRTSNSKRLSRHQWKQLQRNQVPNLYGLSRKEMRI
jgi:hypothetical protein